jgi:Na+/glutamate symporter
MNKRRNILFLVAIFVLLLIKAAHAQEAPLSDGAGIEETAHGVATSGLIFAAIIGGFFAAIRIRATHLRQHSGEGGPQQLGLTQLSAKDTGDRPR